MRNREGEGGKFMTGKSLLPIERIEKSILPIRSKKVMIDADLAITYGVMMKHLNQRVRRNIERFPPDFMLRLTPEEKSDVVTNCDHLEALKLSPYLPYAFTEHGALMLANVLNSPRAIHRLIEPPEKPKNHIGFRVEERRSRYGRGATTN